MGTNVKKSPDMLLLENCFKNLKSKNDISGNINAIERILKRNFDIDFQIEIVDNDTGKFFGMSIYPSNITVELMVQHILYNRSRFETISKLWTDCKRWYLEIDSLLLYDTTLNANPSEIVAVLLHEIGHIVFSNEIPQRVNRIIRFELLNLNYTMKKLIQWKKVHRLFDLVFIEACSSKNYHYINMHTERAADKFVVKMGYGQQLDDFITKLINTQGNSLVNRTENDIDNDVKVIVGWTLENIAELEFRKTKLRTTLQTEIIRNPSKYVRNTVYHIKSLFFGKSEDNYKELLTEQYLINEHRQIVKEGFLDLFDKLGKIKKITQSDIDLLSVETSRIETVDDKIYVLDLIYDKLENIDVGLKLISENKKDKVPVPKETLINYKNQLEKMRKQVLELQIKEKQYGVFIQYPKGYEG